MIEQLTEDDRQRLVDLESYGDSAVGRSLRIIDAQAAEPAKRDAPIQVRVLTEPAAELEQKIKAAVLAMFGAGPHELEVARLRTEPAAQAAKIAELELKAKTDLESAWDFYRGNAELDPGRDSLLRHAFACGFRAGLKGEL